MRTIEARVIRRLCRALDDPYVWVYIGLVCLAAVWVWFVTAFEPFAGGLLR